MAADAATSGTSLVSVGNSALFQQANSEYLSKTPGSAGNRKLWTYSIWFYKVDPVVPLAQQFLHGYVSSGDGGTTLAINADDEFYMQSDGSFQAETTAIFRDIGWYHIVFGMDAANTTCSIEVNGVAQTLTGTFPSDTDYAINNNTLQAIGRYSGGGTPTNYLDGYQAETVFIDGTLYTATDFGEFDSTGLFWTPKSSAEIKALTFGTNGFYLDNTTNAQTDASGEGNNFTNNNTVTTTSTNTPTNSQNLFSPLWPSATSTVTFSNGNKTFAATGGNTATCNRIGVSLPFPGSGKWIMGVSQTAVNDTGKSFGVWTDLDNKIGFPPESGAKYGGWYVSSVTNLYDDAGGYIINLTGNEAADQFWMAVDVDAGKSFAGYWDNSASTITWYAQDAGTDGNPATGDNPLDTGLSLEGKFFACCSLNSKPLTIVEEADIPFTVPSGYNFLSTTNIAAETTRTASDTTKYFDTILYEGNGGGQRVGNFQPFGNAFTVDYGGLFNLVSTGQDTDNAWLTRSQDAGASTKKFTFSFWFKMNDVSLGTNHYIWSDDAASYSGILFNSSEQLQFTSYLSATQMDVATNRVFQDPSQWYHAVVAVDTAQSTALERVRIYVNGVEEAVSVTNQVPQDSTLMSVGDANGISVGAFIASSPPRLPYDGYLAEFVYINNVQLTPSSFGQTDTSTNRWIPKAVSGLTYDATGYYLNFAGATSDLGDDASGNSNDFTNNNNNALRVTDSPTTNYPTLAVQAGVTLSNGNLTCVPTTTYGQAKSGLNFSSQKIFACCLVTDGGSGASVNTTFALAPSTYMPNTSNSPGTGTLASIQTQGTILRIRVNSGSTITHSIAVADGDYFTMAVDPTTGSVWLGVYDTSASTHQYIPAIVGGSAGDPAAGTRPTATPANTTSGHLKCITTGGYQTGSSTTLALNVAAMPMSIPTGFVEFTQDNLTSSDQFISAFSWIKNRDATDNHMLFDRVRGATKDWHSNTDVVEVTNVNTLQSFLAGGVQVGNDAEVNTANESYVLWNWMMEATGSGASNTDGTINTTSTLVDTTLGMSISTYTGASVNGAGTTIGHGLGVAPEMILVKNLSYANSPAVYHSGSWVSASDPGTLFLSGTAARSADTNVFGTSGAVTSSTFTVGDWRGTNYASELFVAYCFAPSQFISLGSYEGNGNADGAFVPTLNSLGVPLQPVFRLTKNIDAVGDWLIQDTGRSPYNVANAQLKPNQAEAETTGNIYDIDTGGFKERAASSLTNKANTHIQLVVGTPIIDTDGRIIAGR